MTGRTDPGIQAWAVRAVGDMSGPDRTLLESLALETASLSPDALLQVAIAASKLDWVKTPEFQANALRVLMAVLLNAGSDPLIPHVVWQNLHPMLDGDGRLADFVRIVRLADLKRSPGIAVILPRVVEKVLASRRVDSAALAALIGLLTEGPTADVDAARKALLVLAERLLEGEPSGAKAFSEPFRPVLDRIIRGSGPNRELARLVTAAWRDAEGLDKARALVAEPGKNTEARRLAFNALVAARDPQALGLVVGVLAQRPPSEHEAYQSHVLARLSRLDHADVAGVILTAYAELSPSLKPRAVELLTQRPAWAKALLAAVADKRLPATALNVTQLRKLQQSKDPEIAGRVKTIWGTIREGRNPQRELVVDQIRRSLRRMPGDPVAGLTVFNKLCAQCHKIHGQGQDVGPDITSNGRNDFDQLVSNVFDPSLVIGPGYQATTLATTDGRVLTGLLAEDGKARIVLKIQGGKIETIPRDQVEQVKTAEVSLMPEDMEKQLAPQEIADLFAFLCLDKPPADPDAKPLPGAGTIRKR
jgi:putative heme-binding domain-containing protein